MAKSIGAALREVREAAGLTQSAVTKAAGLAPGQLSQIESGRSSSPEFATVAKIAAVLGASLNELAKMGGLPVATLDDGARVGAAIIRASEALRAATASSVRLHTQLERASIVLRRELPTANGAKRRKRPQK